MQRSKFRKRMVDGMTVFVLASGIALSAPPGAEGAAEGSGEAAASAEERSASPYSLPTIVVTAEKRETEAQKTPLALTVLSEQDLQDRNIQTLSDVLKEVPNLTMNQGMSGATFMNFRGATTATGTNTNPLVVYVDGVPIDTQSNLDANLMNIERVEVLRGAQSVIYGKNTLGGIINIISKNPSNTYESKVLARVNTDGGYAFGASALGPLKEDKLYFSLAAMHELSGRYMDNKNSSKKNDVTKSRVKGQLRATPTDASEFALFADFTRHEENFTPFVKGTGITTRSPAGPDDDQHSDTINLALTGKVAFKQAVFESVTTYRYQDYDFMMDMGVLMPGFYYSDSGRNTLRDEVTQEFRLRSPDGADGMQWLAGVYGGYGSLDQELYNTFLIPAFLKSDFNEYTKEVAPFGQVEIPITDALKATVGLRWHYTEKNGSIHLRQEMMGVTVEDSRNLNSHWEELLPRLNLSCQITEDHLVYAGVSRSFIPGGFNYASTVGNLEYDKQTAWNYEIGAKTSWFDNRLLANLALFYSEYRDLQIMSWDASINSYNADNAGKSTSYGAELDVTYRLLEGLDIQASVGYTRAVFRDYETNNTLGAVDYSGNRVPFVPTISGTLAVQYRHPSGLFARGEVVYSDKLYWDEANDYYRTDVAVVNARLGYEMENLDIYLYGKNVFGKRYADYYTSVSNISVVAPAQQFGVEFIYRF